MKNILSVNTCFLLSLAIIFVGCASARKVNKWVGNHYLQTVPGKIKSNDYIQFKIDASMPVEKVSETRKSDGQLIPALLFWKWKHETSSNLNPRLGITSFSNYFLSQANSKKLKEKLKGGSVVFTLKSNPADFRLHEDGWLAFVLVYYITKEKIYLEPINPTLDVNYTLTEASGQFKTGILTIGNRNVEKDRRMFQSVKGAINEYLDMSDTNLKIMSAELLDKLMADLAANG